MTYTNKATSGVAICFWWRFWWRFWRQPLWDCNTLLEQLLQHFSWLRMLLLAVSMVLGWWLYVPAHELLHAFGCIWSGGEVTQLDLRAEYGAVWLQQWLPWIAVGSDYAGQLTGFDTRGSDLIYLITVLMPYSLTLFPGMYLWVLALHGNWRRWPAWLMAGFSVSMVAAPFISIFGDMYETAAIIITRLFAMLGVISTADRWRSDDMLLLISGLWAQWQWLDGLVIACTLGLAVLLIWSCYWLGRSLGMYILHLGEYIEHA